MIYLDNAATTKPFPEVVAKATKIMTEQWGNPSSIYEFGEQSKAEISLARYHVAAALGASPDEVYFTSGGTESDNIAIFSGCTARYGAGQHIVTTAVEHAAVSKTVRNLRRGHGYKVDYIGLANGGLDLEALECSITPQTALVSVMLVQTR